MYFFRRRYFSFPWFMLVSRYLWWVQGCMLFRCNIAHLRMVNTTGEDVYGGLLDVFEIYNNIFILQLLIIKLLHRHFWNAIRTHLAHRPLSDINFREQNMRVQTKLVKNQTCTNMKVKLTFQQMFKLKYLVVSLSLQNSSVVPLNMSKSLFLHTGYNIRVVWCRKRGLVSSINTK